MEFLLGHADVGRANAIDIGGIEVVLTERVVDEQRLKALGGLAVAK
ncbi:MAG: hypothetical protein WCF24_07670 [Acidimicrobiales bacterium]